MILLPAILFGISSFAFLLFRLYGTVAPYRDSGDLIAAASSLGIAHPPGYALYTIITHAVMTLIPFGNPAYRVNLLSALWTSLAVVFMFMLLKKHAGSWFALASGLFWFLSPSVQKLSIVSEMYTLHALICVVLICLLYSEELSEKQFLLVAFLIGLAFHNQPTIVFLVPGILVLFHQRWKVWDLNLTGAWVLLGLAGLLGFSLVLCYPIRSMQDPFLDWGKPDSLRNIFRLITRADYGGLKLHPEESHFAWSLAGIFEQIKFFLKCEWEELGIVAMGAAFWGYIQALKEKKSWDMFLGITFLIAGPAFFVLSNLPIGEDTTRPILEPYLLMANLFLLPWMASGIKDLWVRFPSKYAKAGIIMMISGALVYGADLNSRRNDFLGYDYGKNLAHTMPVDSSVYEPDDTTAFVLSYFQIAQGIRGDILSLVGLRTRWGYEQFMQRYPEVFGEKRFKDAQSFIQAMIQYHADARRPLFTDHGSKFPSGMDHFPVGLLSRAGKPADIDIQASRNIWNFYIERGENSIVVDREKEFFSRHVLARMSAALNNMGIAEQGRGNYAVAETYFRKSLAREPKLHQAWVNIGLNSYIQKDYSRAAAIFEQGIQKRGGHELLYYYLGLSRRREGKIKEARESLAKVLQLNPNNSDAANEMGLTYLDEKQWKDAAQWFAQCIKNSSHYPPAHYNLGLCFKNLGFRREAALAFENYLRLMPKADDSAQIRGWIKDLLHSQK